MFLGENMKIDIGFQLTEMYESTKESTKGFFILVERTDTVSFTVSETLSITFSVIAFLIFK